MDSVDVVGGWRGVLLLLWWPADGAEVLLLLGAGRFVSMVRDNVLETFSNFYHNLRIP